jgi:hypothetical protein
VGALRQLWYNPRSERALVWSDNHGVDDADDADATPRLSSVADSVATAGIYPLFKGGDAEEEERAAVAALDLFRPASSPRQEDDEAGFTFKELGIAYNFVPPRRFGDPSLFLDFRPTRWGSARWNQVDPCTITYSLSNP